MEQVEQFTRLPELPRFTGESGAEPFVRKAQLLLQLQPVPPAYAVIWILDALEGRARQEVFDRAPDEINTPEKLLRFIIQRWGEQRDVTTPTQRSTREDLPDFADSAQPLKAPPPDLTFTHLTPHLLAYINQQVAAVEDRLHLSIQQRREDMDANDDHCPPAHRHPKSNKRRSRHRQKVCLWCDRKGHVEVECRAKRKYLTHHHDSPPFMTTPDLPGYQETVAQTVSPCAPQKDGKDRATKLNTHIWQQPTRKPPRVRRNRSSHTPRPREDMHCGTACRGEIKERQIKHRNNLTQRGFNSPNLARTLFREPVIVMAEQGQDRDDLGRRSKGQTGVTSTHHDRTPKHTQTHQFSNKPEGTAPPEDPGYDTDHARKGQVTAGIRQPPQAKPRRSLMLQSSNRDKEVFIVSTVRHRDNRPDAGINLPLPVEPRRSARIAERADIDKLRHPPERDK